MSETITQRLVDGLEEVGRSLHLQVFTAPNGIALLDWVPTEHRVLTLWVHDQEADLRLGTTIHSLVPVATQDQADQLIALLREALVEGAWQETFAIDPETGGAESLTWRIGSGTRGAHRVPSGARPATVGLRVRRLGVRWGPRNQEADLATP